tara:strand:+ start:1185 stop:1379 length:195 start_codon:yes stop_codon:yes gene_type:complete
MKVRIRLQGTKAEVSRLRKHLLKNNPQLILANPREGTNPKYAGKQKWACYGDYEFGKIRRRRLD